MEHKVKLTYGYKDKKGEVHKDVTFGKRPTLNDLILLDTNPMARNPTQREQLTRRLMITKFGTIQMPAALNAFAALDTVDDDLLRRGADEFLKKSREERSGEFLDGNTVKLMFGITLDGVDFDTVVFGRRLTVADNIESDQLGYAGIQRLTYQICKQIETAKDSANGLTYKGEITMDKLEAVDGEDFNLLRLAAEFFRLAGTGTGEKNREADDDGSVDGESDGSEH